MLRFPACAHSTILTRCSSVKKMVKELNKNDSIFRNFSLNVCRKKGSSHRNLVLRKSLGGECQQLCKKSQSKAGTTINILPILFLCSACFITYRVICAKKLQKHRSIRERER